jgi:hypothetical protein
MSYQNELASQNARENQIKVETKKEEQTNDVEFKKCNYGRNKKN